jgi:hypothetical protein
MAFAAALQVSLHTPRSVRAHIYSPEHMFHRASKRLRSVLSILDDVLGDPVDATVPHPHRRPLHWQPTRRPGEVAARPAHCLSPVHRPAVTRRETAVR